MSAPVWFTVIFACTGVVIITLFACRNGVFGDCCKDKHHGLSPSDRYGIGIGRSATDEGMGSSEVTAVRAEPEEEGSVGDDEEESRRGGRLSSDERSEEVEDWGSEV